MIRKRSIPPTESRLLVSWVPLDTPDLFTIEAANAIWTTADFAAVVRHAAGVPRGCFVRVEPPEGESDERVALLVSSLREAGAAAVRVMPRRRRSVVPQRMFPTEDGGAAPGVTVRATVQALVERANTRDRDALRAAVESALAASGL